MRYTDIPIGEDGQDIRDRASRIELCRRIIEAHDGFWVETHSTNGCSSPIQVGSFTVSADFGPIRGPAAVDDWYQAALYILSRQIASNREIHSCESIPLCPFGDGMEQVLYEATEIEVIKIQMAGMGSWWVTGYGIRGGVLDVDEDNEDCPVDYNIKCGLFPLRPKGYFGGDSYNQRATVENWREALEFIRSRVVAENQPHRLQNMPNIEGWDAWFR